MQLKKQSGSVRQALRLATGTLLTGTASISQGGMISGWDVDASVLGYSEIDRVTVIEPQFQMKKELGEEESVQVDVLYDAMTGASATGATPSDQVQTFTTPSGNDYSIQPGDTPVRDFKDQRVSVSGQWTKPFTRMFRTIFGASMSAERDYKSVGLSATGNLDLNNKLSTLSVGLSHYNDTLDPEGGTPTPLASLTDDNPQTNETKTSTDLLLGWTQVLSRRWIVQANYTHGESDGYLTDPYKIVSLVDPVTGRPVDYLYENRPDTRSKDILYFKSAYHFEKDVLHTSYRYFTDDWGVKAHTFDVKYRFDLGQSRYLQPHFRYSMQSAADFYRHSLVNGQPLPGFVSADYRLGEMTTTSLGIKYGQDLDKHSKFGVRFEYMLQSGESNPSDAIGVQRQYDLFPDVEAWIVQLSYSKQF